MLNHIKVIGGFKLERDFLWPSLSSSSCSGGKQGFWILCSSYLVQRHSNWITNKFLSTVVWSLYFLISFNSYKFLIHSCIKIRILSHNCINSRIWNVRPLFGTYKKIFLDTLLQSLFELKMRKFSCSKLFGFNWSFVVEVLSLDYLNCLSFSMLISTYSILVSIFMTGFSFVGFWFVALGIQT